ncbi:MAG: BtrH N-terminal domain-containing protein [Anaerolineales bacterium]|nr:BtrH N-terminal domain-containing protein [Anaerolineales bacterium]
MPLLESYAEFEGLHWETGSVRNYLAYRGIKAPHTGQPWTEALLMGVSGGAVMGYFSFAYEGYDPHVSLLTRNTFDPFDTMLQRLGIAQTVLQSGSQAKGLHNLVDTLESGVPAIVWADAYSLPYNSLPFDEGMWAMMPILVYGYDEKAGVVSIADRSRVPLTITPDELEAARSRVKKTKYRVVTLDPPNPDKLRSAVQLGLWDCIKLYTEKPPKGSAVNFGFKAYARWAELLTRPGAKLSWAKVFPPGREMYSGLTTAFDHIAIFGKDGGAERGLFAEFLEEAATILEIPELSGVADQFRLSSTAWDQLGASLLPDNKPSLKETRQLMLKRHQLFLNKGNAALADIREIDQLLAEIKSRSSTEFPIDRSEIEPFMAGLSEQILDISDLEKNAITDLKAALG